MTPEQILKLLTQALRDGDKVVIVERGALVQVGLRGCDGETVNVTAAISVAFGLPHRGACIAASSADVQKHIDGLAQAKPTPQTQLVQARPMPPIRTNAASAAIDKDVVEALKALGYSVAESKEAVQAIPADAPADFETRFKLALGDGKAVQL